MVESPVSISGALQPKEQRQRRKIKLIDCPSYYSYGQPVLVSSRRRRRSRRRGSPARDGRRRVCMGSAAGRGVRTRTPGRRGPGARPSPVGPHEEPLLRRLVRRRRAPARADHMLSLSSCLSREKSRQQGGDACVHARSRTDRLHLRDCVHQLYASQGLLCRVDTMKRT